jgi:RimJ/RimL family protein N-acetyltransferase
MSLRSNFQLNRYSLEVRLVDESDAEFIVSLRTSSKAQKFISLTENDVNQQREWISEYKKREMSGNEYYFLYSIKGISIGVSRIYNIYEGSFTSGSWIFLNTAPSGTAIVASIIGKEIAFEILGLEKDFSVIHKDNKNVIRFHKMFEPQLTGDDKNNNYYVLTKENFMKHKDKIIGLCVDLTHK